DALPISTLATGNVTNARRHGAALHQPANRFQLRRIVRGTHQQHVVEPKLFDSPQPVACLCRWADQRDAQRPARRGNPWLRPQVGEDVGKHRAFATGFAIHADAEFRILPRAVNAGSDPALTLLSSEIDPALTAP